MKYLLTLVALLMLHPAFCQQETPDCGFYGNKTVAERNALFPFNKAKKVVLVSYPVELVIIPDLVPKEELLPGRLFQDREIIDTVSAEYNGRKVMHYLYEKKEITGATVDELSNIMLNYTTNPEREVGYDPHNCTYWPRNSVLFYDENDNLIANFGVCFWCHIVSFSPYEQDPLPEVIYYRCPEFIKLLQDFFEANRIAYGLRK